MGTNRKEEKLTFEPYCFWRAGRTLASQPGLSDVTPGLRRVGHELRFHISDSKSSCSIGLVRPTVSKPKWG